MSKQLVLLAGTLMFLPLFLSCGDKKNCSLRITVDPASTTVDHTAAPPGNSAQFTALGSFPSGCPLPPIPALKITWSVSDPADVTLTTNTPGGSQVTATCVNASGSSVTVTGSVSSDIKGTAKLKCN